MLIVVLCSTFLVQRWPSLVSRRTKTGMTSSPISRKRYATDLLRLSSTPANDFYFRPNRCSIESVPHVHYLHACLWGSIMALFVPLHLPHRVISRRQLHSTQPSLFAIYSNLQHCGRWRRWFVTESCCVILCHARGANPPPSLIDQRERTAPSVLIIWNS